MAKTNRDRVGEALELLNKGLVPYIEREMSNVYKEKWLEVAAQSLPNKKVNWKDPQISLVIMNEHWNQIFKNTLGHAERSLVIELRDIRNRWAHMENFSTDDTYRALDSVGRLLTAISASEAVELDKKKQELLRVRFEEQRRTEDRKSTAAPIEGQPTGGLKPWRELITPHPDVASGRYQQAEFAADLWQVYIGEGTDEYRDPVEFYRRTFLTEGLKHLLSRAILRLADKGGDPVVELQTNFGGGKTHSMLALFHLVSGISASELPGLEDILKTVDTKVPSGVKRAVIVGTKFSPGQSHRKPDGTVIKTLWGEIAWQLGGKEGYQLVKQADETGTNPGDVMRELFNRYAPCLILIDEWVAYARQLHYEPGLPAGTFDTHFTFAQTLTESARAAKQTLLVISLPASESPSLRAGQEAVSNIEVGGERGHDALIKLKNAIGRMEASWRPASSDEGFEIVRRRLFQPITDPAAFISLDQVARAYIELYGSQQQEFPGECREAIYERRIKAAYPIHPELFDRLYSDWSTLEKFQRTRGVLRLMASVIHCLWERHDGSLLIMPANLPIDEPQVKFELTRYLEDNWLPVIEKDVDGIHSQPMIIDRENPNLGRYSACRRVARTVYLGSAPTQRAANRGIDDRQIKLGCVQPGESPAIFGDALRRLTDCATYLYVDGKRYWYSTQPSVARLAEDRAQQLRGDEVLEEIRRRLREQARQRGDFAKVHACPESADIPDEREARLVILDPEYSHTTRDQESAARKKAAQILESRGNSPRNYRNTLMFLAVDSSRLRDLEQVVKRQLAWNSIINDQSTLNMDPFQLSQARSKQKNADETVDARIPEAFQWLLIPGQPKPESSMEWSEIRQQGQEFLAVRASKKLRSDSLLMLQLGGISLRHELDKIPLWRGDHVGVKQLLEDFATYLYLPRLGNDEVLLDAIKDGCSRLTWAETFAYADQFDEVKGRYLGLQIGQNVRVLGDGLSLLVRPEIAQKQFDIEHATTSGPNGTASSGALGRSGNQKPSDESSKPSNPPASLPAIRRFHGSVVLDPQRLGRDASKIAEEVVQHLTGLVGAKVEVVLEIRAEVQEGVSESIVRTVSENCRTLKFDTHGFENE